MDLKIIPVTGHTYRTDKFGTHSKPDLLKLSKGLLIAAHALFTITRAVVWTPHADLF